MIPIDCSKRFSNAKSYNNKLFTFSAINLKTYSLNKKMFKVYKYQSLWLAMFMANFLMFFKFSKLEDNYHTQIIFSLETMSIEDLTQSKQSLYYVCSNSSILQKCCSSGETTNLEPSHKTTAFIWNARTNMETQLYGNFSQIFLTFSQSPQ